MSAESATVGPVAVDYAYRDFLAFAKDLRRRRQWWVDPLIALAAIAMVWASGGLRDGNLVILLIVFMLVCGILWVARLAILPLTAKLMEWKHRRSKFGGTQQVALSPEMLLVSGPLGDTRVPWAMVENVRVVGDTLLLYLTRRSAFLVPARCFESAAAFDQFAASANNFRKGANS